MQTAFSLRVWHEIPRQKLVPIETFKPRVRIPLWFRFAEQETSDGRPSAPLTARSHCAPPPNRDDQENSVRYSLLSHGFSLLLSSQRAVDA